MKTIAVITGAGISAESGVATYQDFDEEVAQHSYYQVASAKGWRDNREMVLSFWNKTRKVMLQAQPNAAHLALVKLQQHFQVNIITQNVDNLHERAGSISVLHLHGEIVKARSSRDRKLVYELGDKDILLGDLCEKSSQLRPHIVFFGEDVPLFPEAVARVKEADILLVIGCALDVYPAASLLQKCKKGTQVYKINPDLDEEDEFNIRQPATVGVTRWVDELIAKCSAS